MPFTLLDTQCTGCVHHFTLLSCHVLSMMVEKTRHNYGTNYKLVLFLNSLNFLVSVFNKKFLSFFDIGDYFFMLL